MRSSAGTSAAPLSGVSRWRAVASAQSANMAPTRVASHAAAGGDQRCDACDEGDHTGEDCRDEVEDWGPAVASRAQRGRHPGGVAAACRKAQDEHHRGDDPSGGVGERRIGDPQAVDDQRRGNQRRRHEVAQSQTHGRLPVSGPDGSGFRPPWADTGPSSRAVRPGEGPTMDPLGGADDQRLWSAAVTWPSHRPWERCHSGLLCRPFSCLPRWAAARVRTTRRRARVVPPPRRRRRPDPRHRP